MLSFRENNGETEIYKGKKWIGSFIESGEIWISPRATEEEIEEIIEYLKEVEGPGRLLPSTTKEFWRWRLDEE